MMIQSPQLILVEENADKMHTRSRTTQEPMKPINTQVPKSPDHRRLDIESNYSNSLVKCILRTLFSLGLFLYSFYFILIAHIFLPSSKLVNSFSTVRSRGFISSCQWPKITFPFFFPFDSIKRSNTREHMLFHLLTFFCHHNRHQLLANVHLAVQKFI